MGKIAVRLAAALREPDAVKELDLSGSNGDQLAEVPASIAKLKNLEVLRLDRNGLTQLPEAIGKLKVLRELHAAHNQLTSEGIHRSVWFIKTLEVLNLHGNQLHWIDNVGNYQKTEMALYLGGNPLDVSAYTMAGRPVHPLWKHVLHMMPLSTYGKFRVRVLALDTDRIAFPLPDQQLHYEPPFPHVQALQLYGRAPTADERTQLGLVFPDARIEHHTDIGKGPHFASFERSPAPAPKKKTVASKPRKK